jgi:hypothetical protein
LYSKETFSVSGLDLGSDCAGDDLQGYLMLKNSGNYRVHIKNILVSGSNFSIGSYAEFVEPRDSISVNVSFNSKIANDYNETVTVEIDQPCPWSYSSNISARRLLKLKAWLPDTSASINQKSFVIPVFARLTCGQYISQDINFTAVISFDVSAFLPFFGGVSRLVNHCVQNNERVLTIEGHMYVADTIGSAVIKIPGLLLLPDQEKTSVNILKFETDSKNILFDNSNGSLSVIGPCKQTYSRVKLFDPPSVSVLPNPARDEVMVSLSGLDGNPVSLGICSLQGISLYSGEFVAVNTKRDVKIDISSFPPGIYFIIAKSSSGTFSRPFIKVE